MCKRNKISLINSFRWQGKKNSWKVILYYTTLVPHQSLIFTRRNIWFTILYRTPFILRANANLLFRYVQILAHLIPVPSQTHVYTQILSAISLTNPRISNQPDLVAKETTVPFPIIVTRHLTICCSNSIVHPPIPLI